ncbi:MAG: flagellar protein FliT [Sutterellaceae bacterium]|nr:flagellar protein FliT [Burkholderiaceae bacterium]MCX7902001.1 flagellar protein FliT [Burkholderiaceae bacterium]MDW8430896.1 flagellar protein FliT [Sutterellaceae bacterium]
MPEDSRPLGHCASSGAVVIACYEAIARASRQMLAAARADDWAQVQRLEEQCRDLIVTLKQAARGSRLSVAEQRRRIELLRGILADDAEIRRRAEPWLQQLERLLTARRSGREPG